MPTFPSNITLPKVSLPDLVLWVKIHKYFKLEYFTKARDPGVIPPTHSTSYYWPSNWSLNFAHLIWNIFPDVSLLSLCCFLCPSLFLSTSPLLPGHLTAISNLVAATLTQVLLTKAKYDYTIHRLIRLHVSECLRNVLISKLMRWRPLTSRRNSIGWL